MYVVWYVENEGKEEKLYLCYIFLLFFVLNKAEACLKL